MFEIELGIGRNEYLKSITGKKIKVIRPVGSSVSGHYDLQKVSGALELKKKRQQIEADFSLTGFLAVSLKSYKVNR